MRPEVVFVAAYACLLLVGALGLDRLGRVSASPWASRVLAGYRRAVPEPLRPAAPDDSFPHVEAPRLHTGIAATAATAALLLAAAELVRHHRPAEAALLGLVALAALLMLRRLVGSLRAAGAGRSA